MTPSIHLRLATESDLPAINDIYNHYVTRSTCTYQEQLEPIEGRQHWFAKHKEKHPVVVVEMDKTIVGWGSLSEFRERSAYRFAVEDTVYIHHDHHGRGIGSMILKDLIDRARTLGHRTVIAGIDAEQIASVALHAKFGFQQVADLKQVGFKFDRWLDVIYMQLLLT